MINNYVNLTAFTLMDHVDSSLSQIYVLNGYRIAIQFVRPVWSSNSGPPRGLITNPDLCY